MRALSYTTAKGGLNRQRIKGGTKAETLYDALNCYQTGAKTWVQRDGTIRDAVLAATSVGLTAFQNILHTFTTEVSDYTPVGYLANVLAHPDPDSTATLDKIHFAEPFMGALYVVAEWSDGRIAHYWLASTGAWEAERVHFNGDVVTPTVPNGLLYKAVPAPRPDPLDPDSLFNPVDLQTWQPLKNYVVGDKVLPTTYNGFYYEVTATQGDVPLSGAVEPAWEASEGAEVVESTDSTGAPASSASPESAPEVPPDVRDRYGTGNTQLSAASEAAVGVSDSVRPWAPGTLYNPGDLVKPRSVAPVINSAIPNANFELGDVSWTKGTGWTIKNTGTSNGNKPYQGAWFAHWQEFDTGGAWHYLEMSTTVPVVPGQFLSASCYDSRGGGNNSAMDGQLVLLWYDAYDVLVKETLGTFSSANNAKDYRPFTVQDVTPGGAVKVKVAYKARGGNTGGQCAIDSFTWDYVNLTPVEADFTVYQAVQAAAGVSGTDEPVWPGAGNQVVDNEVTWQGGVTSVITWTAVPIMKSGTSEPTWQEQPGSATEDNTISWLATTGYVEEAPNSKVVALAAKKVFAADDDIVRYSATVNPLDWTTAEDAGYLPVGLNTYGANPTAVLALYRSNLIAFNSAGFQMWQLDPDPELMSLLDAVPIGSTYHKAAQSVKNDLLFLTELGVRSIGIAGASTNLKAGDVGDPIDVLVAAELAAGTYEPFSIYYPARGQYWLIFGPQVFVLTLNDFGPSWSRYVFPEALTYATLLGNAMYLRTETNKVWKVDAAAVEDDYTPAQDTWAPMAIITAGADSDPNVTGFQGSPFASIGTLDFYSAAQLPAWATGLAQALTFNDTPDILRFTLGRDGGDPQQGDIPAFRIGSDVYLSENATAFVVASDVVQWEFELQGPLFVDTVEYTIETQYLAPATGVEYEGVLWWPALDNGSLGQNKQLDSFDLVCNGEVAVQFGYDQRDPTVLTDDYVLDGDTLPGTSVPFPLSGPSFAPKLTFSGGQAWEWMALNLYLQDSRGSGFAG